MTALVPKFKFFFGGGSAQVPFEFFVLSYVVFCLVIHYFLLV